MTMTNESNKNGKGTTETPAAVNGPVNGPWVDPTANKIARIQDATVPAPQFLSLHGVSEKPDEMMDPSMVNDHTFVSPRDAVRLMASAPITTAEVKRAALSEIKRAFRKRLETLSRK